MEWSKDGVAVGGSGIHGVLPGTIADYCDCDRRLGEQGEIWANSGVVRMERKSSTTIENAKQGLSPLLTLSSSSLSIWVFAELQDALNTVWEVQAGTRIINIIRSRFCHSRWCWALAFYCSCHSCLTALINFSVTCYRVSTSSGRLRTLSFLCCYHGGIWTGKVLPDVPGLEPRPHYCSRSAGSCWGCI